MAYSVSFKSSALRQLQKLPKPVVQRVLAKASALSNEPRLTGSIKLTGAENLWRVRVGDYRIVYAISDAARTVDVRIVAHRREVYRDL